MKKVYLVDSENVADLWVTHLMKLAEPEDDIIVFYTQKSPHMGYDHIRMLLNSTHEVEFVKCAEGQNALDFQLVTELGYRLGRGIEGIEYIVVTNDNGFDAAVKYWQNREMPVKRYNAKYCHNLVNQLKAAENVVEESEQKNVPVTIQLLQELQEEPKEIGTESAIISVDDIVQQEKMQENKETIMKVDSVAEENKTEPVVNILFQEKKTEVTSEAFVKGSKKDSTTNENQKKKDEAASVKKSKEKRSETKQDKNEKLDNQEQQVIASKEKKNRSEPDTGEALIKDLVSCIGIKNIPDIHNALICLLGDQKGKQLYKQVKGKLSDYKPANKMQIRNRFKTYCQIVFEHSEQKEECPKDITKIVYDAKEKRKNLNSFRSALQNEYGKEKGMSYYTIIKPHVKILNLMQNA